MRPIGGDAISACTMRAMATLDRSRATALVEPHWRRALQLRVPAHARSRSRRALHRRHLRARGRQARRACRPNEAAAVVWLLGLANQMLEERLPRQPEVNFDILDDTLRNEATRTDVVRSLSDPQRDFLLWELKQGCMTAVVNCLPPGERAAFVTCHVIKLDRRSSREGARRSPRARTRSGCRARARRSATTSRRAASTSTR